MLSQSNCIFYNWNVILNIEGSNRLDLRTGPTSEGLIWIQTICLHVHLKFNYIPIAGG